MTNTVGIFAQAKEARLPGPKIGELVGRERFTVRLEQPLVLTTGQSRRRQTGIPESNPLAPLSQSEQVGEQVLLALTACSDGPKSKAQLLAAMGLNSVYLKLPAPCADHVGAGSSGAHNSKQTQQPFAKVPPDLDWSGLQGSN